MITFNLVFFVFYDNVLFYIFNNKMQLLILFSQQELIQKNLGF